jgi:DNA-binding winged helix-turn-helix (wHTH) protein/Tol biopolymer transport system component
LRCLSSKIRSKIIKEIIKAIMSNEINSLYEFGEFKFDPQKGKLWQNGELILLSPKATELLALLLEKKGEFVEKQEIFETVWKDTFVEDGVLTQNIYTLRKALGNDSDGLPIIENKTRLGYRITVPINLLENSNGIHISQGIEPTIAENQQNKLSTKNRKSILIFASFVILVSIIGFLGYSYFRPRIAAYFRKPIESVKFTQLTNTGDLSNAALAPDGNLLAFVRGDKVFLKDIVSNKEIPLQIPNINSVRSLQFSADGNFLYFRHSSSAFVAARVMKVSRFGGDSQVVAEQTFGSFSLSPDNKFLAYYSRDNPDPIPILIVRNLETKEERQIFKADGTLSLCDTCSPAWSPDSKKIILSHRNWTAQPSKVYVIDVDSGSNETINFPKLRRVEQAVWFPDGRSFVVSASEDSKTFHLWKVFYPDGDTQPITNGLSSYQNVVASADGKKLLALQTNENANIFIADTAKLTEQKQITSGNSNNFGQSSLVWFDDRNVVFSAKTETDTVENLWSIDAEGQSKRQITSETNLPAVTPNSDGKFVYYGILRKGIANISRINSNGENQTEITVGTDGGRRSPQISPDGNWLYYIFRNKDGGKIMRRNLSTQIEEVFFESEKVQCGLFLALSVDGKYLACPNWLFYTRNRIENYNTEIAVIPTENKDNLAFIPIGNIPPIFRFSPDSKAIEFISDLDSGTQLMRQSFAESEPNPILSMPKDRIFNFAWSKNGKQLAISRGQQYRDAVLLSEFDK